VKRYSPPLKRRTDQRNLGQAKTTNVGATCKSSQYRGRSARSGPKGLRPPHGSALLRKRKAGSGAVRDTPHEQRKAAPGGTAFLPVGSGLRRAGGFRAPEAAPT